jgi:hypothetical protein
MKLQDPICKTLLDVKLIFSLHCMSLFFLIGSCTLINMPKGWMYTSMILLKLSKCIDPNYMNFMLILNEVQV